MRGSKWGGNKPGRPRRGRWSQAEIARLKELYGLRDDELIAKELGRPVSSVRRMAHSLFPLAVKTGPWTDEETAELKRYLGASGKDVIARVLGRTVAEVDQRIAELRRVQHAGRWSQDEISELKRLYGTRTDEDLATVFGRTVESVRRLATKLCLAKDKAFLRKLKESQPTRMPRWTKEEIARLEQIYPTYSNLEIAQELNRSVKSVVSKAHILGLKKDRSRLQEMGRENVSLRYRKGREEE